MGKLKAQFEKDVQDRAGEILAHRIANQEAFLRVFMAETGIPITRISLVEEQDPVNHLMHWSFAVREQRRSEMVRAKCFDLRMWVLKLMGKEPKLHPAISALPPAVPAPPAKSPSQP